MIVPLRAEWYAWWYERANRNFGYVYFDEIPADIDCGRICLRNAQFNFRQQEENYIIENIAEHAEWDDAGKQRNFRHDGVEEKINPYQQTAERKRWASIIRTGNGCLKNFYFFVTNLWRPCLM